MHKGQWKSFNELKLDYPSVSLLGENRVCFNIKGNNYRLIVKINFIYQMIWIRFIGTHEEYNKIDSKTI
ncbi:type II toxin-antitoxin system HigB family toxin [Sphingobacterium lactis]|uniref:type II toxin-antitoxin system HigB family toxin n=1 Tax=Sphingobacterium lactis TaxID=797291 RepID=UPI003DA31339